MTLVPFQPNPTSSPPFTAQVTLDGAGYTLTCTWSLYRNDWYMQITDQNGNLVINQPLIGSPSNADIYLAPGMFTSSTLVYRVSTQNFEVTP
jgi:hypothetical protein